MRNLPRLLSLLALALSASACTIEFIDQDGDDDDPGGVLDGGSFWPDALAEDGGGFLPDADDDGGFFFDGGGAPDADTWDAGSSCGDGILQVGAGEQCDNGQPGVNTATCDRDCTLAACGDALVNFPAGEQCDTGSVSTSCDPDCTAVVCGDGLVNPAAGEQCDDGNFVDTDGCRNDCILP